MRKLCFFMVLFISCIATVRGEWPERKFLGLNGNIKSIIQTRKGDTDWKKQYDFTAKGDIIRIVTTTKTRKESEQYEYNEQNRLVRITEYEDSIIVRQKELIYQDYYKKEWKTTYKNGSCEYRIEEWNPEASILWFSELAEDHTLKRIGRSQFDKQGNVIKRIWEYEDEYRKSQSRDVRDRLPQMSWFSYGYNDKNELLPVEHAVIDNDPILNFHSRVVPLPEERYIKYDKKDNWTECIFNSTTYYRTYIYSD